MEKRIRAEVSGRVQGVGFRMFIYRCAVRLELAGRVRNLDNGNVEIDVQGSEGAVSELVAAARIGPPASSVSGVTVQPLPVDLSIRDFSVAP